MGHVNWKYVWTCVKCINSDSYLASAVSDAQADLGLRCPHMPKDMFSHRTAHMIIALFPWRSTFILSCPHHFSPFPHTGWHVMEILSTVSRYQFIRPDCHHIITVAALINISNNHFSPQLQENYFWTRVPSEYSDQPAHSRSLISIFTGRLFWVVKDAKFLDPDNEDLCACADWFEFPLGAHVRRYVFSHWGSFYTVLIWYQVHHLQKWKW